MDDGRVTAELMPQNPAARPTHLYKELEKHLASPDIVGCRVASAYVTWGGLSLVSDALEEFLRRGKQLQTIFGTGNTLTTPDALLYAHYLKTRYPKHQRARTFKWEYGNTEFHPKYYEFQYSDRVVVLVGSSNLTNGGMAFNHELLFAVTAVHSDSVGRSCERWWKWLWAKSNDVTPKLIRALREDNALGKEPARQKKPGRTEFISLKLPRAKKPLFQYLLDDEATKHIKHDLLADADTLSEKPERLYLEILEHETGGGHQIQLPVATLGAFFGVGKGEEKDATFRFPRASESVHVNLTHFDNNTHRIRLLPLKDIPRPAIVVFERLSDPSTFDCRVVSPSQYQSTLQRKCPEQTRQGSRHWGFEQ
jgi:HKD family nuclease